MRWTRISPRRPDTATYLGQFNAWIGKDARFSLFVMNAGGKLVRQEVRVATKGEGSDFQLRGVNLLSGETHTDVTMVLDHAVPHTTSRELVRNVVTGRAHGVFQGRINVHQVAQKTDAKMACNTLLLSDDGEFSTKPELEIFADDVACGHGATVTEIDHPVAHADTGKIGTGKFQAVHQLGDILFPRRLQVFCFGNFVGNGQQGDGHGDEEQHHQSRHQVGKGNPEGAFRLVTAGRFGRSPLAAQTHLRTARFSRVSPSSSMAPLR